VKKLALLALAGSALLGACRGQPSDKEPWHLSADQDWLMGNMDWQPKYQPEKASPLWEDGRAMRPLVPGVVAQGHLQEDEGYFTGKVGDKYLAVAPVEMNEKLLKRGQERFGIYCTPCHDKTGSGHGMVIQHGYPTPVKLTDDRVRGMPDGQIFWTITNGVRNMPYYRKQIPVEDRWAIVAWVRVLGRSQHATMDDVPDQQRDKIEQEVPGQ
jgi:mono/diheme cytochrome c family protein